jgi:hypothetical protein
MVLGHYYEFRLSAATDDPKNALPGPPQTYFMADCFHLTGKLEAGYMLWKTHGRRVPAQALEDVCAIQRSGAHAYSYSIRCGVGGSFDLANFESFNPTVSDNCHGFHDGNGKS